MEKSPGPQFGVHLQEVFAYGRCLLAEVRLYTIFENSDLYEIHCCHSSITFIVKKEILYSKVRKLIKCYAIVLIFI